MSALGRPNTELVTDPIRHVSAHISAHMSAQTIVTADGHQRPSDALVCATGFETVHLLCTLRVTGLGGRARDVPR